MTVKLFAGVCGCLVLPLVTTTYSSDAVAAVRLCSVTIESSAHAADTELEAKKLALADWTRRVAHLGPGFASWRIAADKKLECKLAETSRMVCRASARPCTISQVVPRPSIRT